MRSISIKDKFLISMTTTTTTLSRRASILQANKSTSLIKYIESVLKKQREDEDYAKWDITVRDALIIIIIINHIVYDVSTNNKRYLCQSYQCQI